MGVFNFWTQLNSCPESIESFQCIARLSGSQIKQRIAKRDGVDLKGFMGKIYRENMYKKSQSLTSLQSSEMRCWNYHPLTDWKTHTLTGVGARGDAIASKNMYKKLKSLKICIKSNSLKICIKNLYLTSVLREILKLAFHYRKGLKSSSRWQISVSIVGQIPEEITLTQSEVFPKNRSFHNWLFSRCHSKYVVKPLSW